MVVNYKLARQQKEAIGLLSIGTLLEYFDLMLYVHLSVLLNDLFFPQTDPLIAKLLGATAFCMTFILRPVGGYVIGKIGDNVGRKFTIMITTFIMAGCCLTMAMLPTYEEIGMYATIGILACRMLQGFSSLGEIMGAGLYLAETLKSPYKYVANGIIDLTARIGGFLALGVASLVISSNFNWRYAFFFGAAISLIGFMARTRLREASEFVNYKYRMNVQKNLHQESIINKKINKKYLLGLFFSVTVAPLTFYLSYIYIGEFMKTNLGLTSKNVINHNFLLSLFDVVVLSIFAYLYKSIHPLKVIKVSAFIFIICLLMLPYSLENIDVLGGENLIFVLQIALGQIGAINLLIWFKYFPISSRFTSVATTFGVGSASGYAISSYGLIPLVDWFGYYGIWGLYLPFVIGLMWSLNLLKKLEIERGSYHNYPYEEPPNEDTVLKEDDFEYEDLGDEYEPFKNKCEYSKQLMNKLDEFNKDNNIKLNIRLIEKAIVFAKKWHGTQMRKTGDHPFYWHPLSVAGIVVKYTPKTDLIVAAILHDVVEDSDCTVELIEEKFNKRIAEIVDRLTKKRFENGKHIKLSLEETLNRLQKLDDNEALFIKQIDRQHNLETIEGLSPEKQRKMAEETQNHFVSLVAIIGDKLNIYGKIHLENKMFKYSYDILKNVDLKRK